jgi:release factor glutamine methyltransferase
MTAELSALAGRSRREALGILREAFTAAGIDSPEVDARRLLTAMLGIDTIALVTAGDVALSDTDATRLAAAAARRIAREPVSRILGRRWFYGRPFDIGRATLDPRPESETLIDAVLGLLAETPASAPRLLDLGTGSGCLLLTLLAERSDAHGIGTDVSADALVIARRNADRLGVTARAEFRLGADFEPIATNERASFDFVLSNPPYIPCGLIGSLEPEVCDHDPWAALDGGSDGLDLYRRFTDGIPFIQPKGWVIFEVGDGQAGDVLDLLTRAFLPNPIDTRTFDDLAGVSRCVAVRARS